MVYAALVLLGLCFGSFVNALVWRVHMQQKKGSAKHKRELSIMHGRSMCPHCRHTLSARDLLPVVSWVMLGGKCRYCKKAISWQYPLVELTTAGLFLASFAAWPFEFDGVGVFRFGLWLALLVGFMALIVYDLRWMLLPNRIVFPLQGVAAVYALMHVLFIADNPAIAVMQVVSAVAAIAGLFWVLFQVSDGKWIGGGDVKLGVVLGLAVGSLSHGVLTLFLASLLGTLYALPQMARRTMTRTSKVPFGPFLIVGACIVVLCGARIIAWYQTSLLGY